MYIEKKVQFRSLDGVIIKGIYAQYPKTKPGKCILMLHGLSTHKNEYLNFYGLLSQKLVSETVSTLRIDFRGHGESGIGPADFTVCSQIIDLIASLNWLSRERNIQSFQLFGTSFGAVPCILADKLIKYKIEKISLVAPVLSFRQVFLEPISTWGKETFTDMTNRAFYKKEKISITRRFFLGHKIITEMNLLDIENSLKNIKTPIQIMHGEKDDMVSSRTSIEMSNKYNFIKLYLFKNMEHGFTDYGDETGKRPQTLQNIDAMIKIIKG